MDPLPPPPPPETLSQLPPLPAEQDPSTSRGSTLPMEEDDVEEGSRSSDAWFDRFITKSGNDAAAYGTMRNLREFQHELQTRSTMSTVPSGSLKKVTKHATVSGKISGLALRGSVLNLKRSPFDDFPELKFMGFPTENLELSKDQYKELGKLKLKLDRDRESLLKDRNKLLAAQRERDEKLMKAFQEDNNKKGALKLKEFQSKMSQQLKERKEANDPMSQKEIQEAEEFSQQQILQELERAQLEAETRLVNQRLKWILPWFQQMKAMEMVQYTRVHQMETNFLSARQAEDIKQFESSQHQMAKIDEKAFNKELKGTVTDRKKERRPMEKQEIAWEKEAFARSQQSRFDESYLQLNEQHDKQRQELELAQAAQMQTLENYYAELEMKLIGMKTTEL